MLALIGFLLTIIIVVTVHEFGHYLAARFFRLRILRFSVGFGKPIWMRTDKRGTEWVLAPIPLGGYVRMLEQEEASAKGLPFAQTLESRPPWQRFVVFGAGPLANFILAALLYTGMSMVGEQQIRPVVGDVRPDSPAALAGFAKGDEIALVNNRSVESWREVWARFVDSVAEEEAVLVRTITGAERVIPVGDISLDDLARGLYNGVGVSRDFSYLTSAIKRVLPGAPADRAGVLAGDVVVMANDALVEDFEDLLTQVVNSPNAPLTLVLWRDGEDLKTVAQLDARENGRGFLGVEPEVDSEKYDAIVSIVRRGPVDALLLAIVRVWEETARVFKFLWLLATLQLSAEHLSGPVGIANQAGAAAELGALSFLRFLAFISVNLGAINLAPLPLLDGGQMALCVIQSVRRRPLPDRIRAWLERFGVALIVALMTFVIINDILKLW